MFVLENAPNKENFTQLGLALALMPSENTVDNKFMKELKGGVTSESLFVTTCKYMPHGSHDCQLLGYVCHQLFHTNRLAH